MLIGTVAEEGGVSTSALRYYESVGLIPPPQRINGRRVYDRSIFSYLATIRLAQDSGFTVSEMKQLLETCAAPSSNGMSNKVSQGWKNIAQAKVEELERTIARAEAMKVLLNQWLDCQCVSLSDCELIATRLERPT